MDKQKEVYFNVYCKTCKHKNVDQAKDPCHECLASPSNTNSHKPVNWEKK